MHYPAILASWSIPRKLAFLLLAIFLPALGILLMSGLAHRRLILSDANKDSLLLAQSLAAQQEQIAVGTKQMLSTLAHLPEVRGMDAKACNELFRDLQNQHPFYSIISAATPSGDMFAASIPFEAGKVNLADRKHFKEVLQTLDFAAGEYVMGKVSEVQSLHFSYPVLDRDRNLVAVVSAALKLNEYARFIEKAALPRDSAVVLLDYRGVRLFRSPENGAAALGKPIPKDAFNRVSGDSEHGVYEIVAEDGMRRIYAFRQLRLREGLLPYLYVLVGIAKDKILHQVNLELTGYLCILGIAALLTALLAWVLGNLALIGPIKQLVSTTRRFGAGELCARSGLPHTPNEIGQLAKSFDHMALLLESREMERKSSETALRESESSYRKLSHEFQAVLNVIPDTVSLISPEMKILWTNRSSSEKPAAEIIPIDSDLHCYELRHQRTSICKGCPIEAAFVRGRFASSHHRTPDGRLWEVRAVPVKDETGNVVSVVEVARDVTEQHDLESRLRQAQKMEAVGTLAGGIAHEFNNVLAIILGNVELALLCVSETNKTPKYLHAVRTASLRGRDIIRQLLSFSRKSEAERGIIDVGIITKESLKFLRASIPANVEIRATIPQKLSRINADATQIHQILINLCTNAVHAMEKDGGLLEIRLADVEIHKRLSTLFDHLEPGDYLRLSVSDTGHGIAPEDMGRIFEPFFTKKEVGKGSGMGLAVVHGIVKSYSGGITVESHVGRGTTVSVYFPADEAAVLSELSEEPALPAGTERVFLVDDEEELVAMIREVLINLGYSVEARTSSLEALELFRHDPGRYDVLITDMSMPKMMGDALAEEIMRIRPDIPVILCTGFSERIDEERARGMGIRAFMQKPLAMRDLALTLRKVLDQ